MKKLRELSKEDLKRFANKEQCLTVGKLKKFLNEHQLPDDAVVVVQRVEDIYYEKHNWGVYLKKGEYAHNAGQWNKDIESGKYLDKEQYPKMKEENLVPYTEDDIKELMEQYTPTQFCVRYKDDEDVLFIDMHY